MTLITQYSLLITLLARNSLILLSVLFILDFEKSAFL